MTSSPEIPDGAASGVSAHRVAPDGRDWTAEAYRVRPQLTEAAELADFARRVEAAVARADGIEETVELLNRALEQAGGLEISTIVLMGPGGVPIFAGGHSTDHTQLLAMERTRRNGAPMVIWQAYEENQVVVDATWFRRIHTDDRYAPLRSLVGSRATGAYLALPLRDSEGMPFGAVGALVTEPTDVTPDAVRRWMLLADQVALGLLYSELIRRARARGGESERLRTGEALHRTLAQTSFALALELAKAEARLPAGDGDVLCPLGALVRQLDVEIRAFLSDSAHAAPRPGFAEQLAALQAAAARRSGAEIALTQSVEWDELAPDVLDDVERILSEALRNVVKHSGATKAEVTAMIEPESGDLLLTVTDNGAGPGPEGKTDGKGHGLDLVRRVVAERDGQLRLSERPGGGTEVLVRLRPAYTSEWTVARRSLDNPHDTNDRSG